MLRKLSSFCVSFSSLPVDRSSAQAVASSCAGEYLERTQQFRSQSAGNVDSRRGTARGIATGTWTLVDAQGTMSRAAHGRHQISGGNGTARGEPLSRHHS